MLDTFEDNIHLEPEITWKDCAIFIYDAIMEGKLNREEFTEFFLISGQEMSEPRHARIFAKVIGTFFKKYYDNLKPEEKPGVFVTVDKKNFIVSHNDKEITIEEIKNFKDISDCSFLIIHETEADAKIAAWEKGEKYKERLS